MSRPRPQDMLIKCSQLNDLLMEEGELSQEEICSKMKLTYFLARNLIDSASYIYPIYEITDNNKLKYGVIA